MQRTCHHLGLEQTIVSPKKISKISSEALKWWDTHFMPEFPICHGQKIMVSSPYFWDFRAPSVRIPRWPIQEWTPAARSTALPTVSTWTAMRPTVARWVDWGIPSGHQSSMTTGFGGTVSWKPVNYGYGLRCLSLWCHRHIDKIRWVSNLSQNI